MNDFLGINLIFISFIIIVSTFGSCFLFAFVINRKKENETKHDKIEGIEKSVNSINDKLKNYEKKGHPSFSS